MQMNKSIILIIILFPFICLAQPGLPLIRAHGTSIAIKDGNTLIKGQWVAMPQYRPDIYRTIRSDSTRQVTFYTDMDSISFTLAPGDQKDFIILVNGKDSCYTRISTLKGTQLFHEIKGVFMQTSVWPWLLIGAALLAIASWYFRKRLSLKILLSMGVWIPFIFWTGTIIGGFIHGDYNQLSQVVSELGAVGTRSQVFMSGITVLLSVLSLYFIAGLLIACKRLRINVLPVLSIFSFTIMLFFTGMFPMGNPLHNVTGPIFFVLQLGVLLALILWRRADLKTIWRLSLVSFLLMSLIFLRFAGSLQADYPGLIQRFAHLGWSVWFVSLCLGMRNLVSWSAK
jgi:hypothetical protein